MCPLKKAFLPPPVTRLGLSSCMQKRHRFDFERQCKTALGAAPPLLKSAKPTVCTFLAEDHVGTEANSCAA